MDFFISSAYAQTAGAPAAPSMLPTLLIYGVLIVAMFFFMVRPQMKRAKEQRALMSSLAKGDEVVTSGGLAGRIADINDTFLNLEIATNVIVKIQKSAVSTVLPKGSLKSA
jgi:preprotein translocase subunit YajC